MQTAPMRRLRHQRGLTMIETTVLLSVMFILAGVMTPIVSESVTTARAVRAKNDAEQIAVALINFQRDLAGGAFSSIGTTESVAASASTGAAPTRMSSTRHRPEVLITEGSLPAIEERAVEASVGGIAGLLVRPRSADGEDDQPPADLAQRRRWIEAARDLLDDHVISNRSGYRFRSGGEYGGGWNGPYLNKTITGDPWGRQYLVNVAWLANRGGRRAVFVVSAGHNGVIETPYEQSILDARAFGDDIVVRIQ